MNESQDTGDKPSKEIRAAILGSTDLNSIKSPWVGEKKPDMVWLAKPLKNLSGDKVAKQSCTGCGMEGEVSFAHLERFFSLAETKLDCRKIDWKNSFLLVSACDFCVESTPTGSTIVLVIDKMLKK